MSIWIECLLCAWNTLRALHIWTHFHTTVWQNGDYNYHHLTDEKQSFHFLQWERQSARSGRASIWTQTTQCLGLGFPEFVLFEHTSQSRLTLDNQDGNLKQGCLFSLVWKWYMLCCIWCVDMARLTKLWSATVIRMQWSMWSILAPPLTSWWSWGSNLTSLGPGPITYTMHCWENEILYFIIVCKVLRARS